jgi:hypothetical protein
VELRGPPDHDAPALPEGHPHESPHPVHGVVVPEGHPYLLGPAAEQPLLVLQPLGRGRELPRVQEQLGVPARHVVGDVDRGAESEAEGRGAPYEGRQVGRARDRAVEGEAHGRVDVVVVVVDIVAADAVAVAGAGCLGGAHRVRQGERDRGRRRRRGGSSSGGGRGGAGSGGQRRDPRQSRALLGRAGRVGLVRRRRRR